MCFFLTYLNTLFIDAIEVCRDWFNAMLSKRYFRIFIILILSISMLVTMYVIRPWIYKMDMTPVTSRAYNKPDRRWKPSNPAMTNCIGYANPKTSDGSSSCEKRLPNTLIIGVAKCGTHALLTFLGQHPQIVRNTDIGASLFFTEHYTKGLGWYKNRMPYSLPGQVVIERIRGYFIDGVPERIFNLNPRIKLLLAVRNPVDRAVSAYAMMKSFHDNKNETIQGVKPGDIFPPFELIWKELMNVFYDTSLEHWLQYFRIEQIHFVDGDILRKSPVQELKKIEQFLNIEPFFHDTHFYLNTTRGVFCMSKPRFGQTNCLGEGKGRKHPKVNETVLEIMRDILRPHNQRFYELSRRHFSWDTDTAIK